MKVKLAIPARLPMISNVYAAKRFYLRKQLTQRATKRNEAESDHAKYERQNEEVFCAPGLISAWHVIDHIVCRDVQFKSVQADDNDHGQYEQRETVDTRIA